MLSGSSPTADTPPRGRSHYEKCSKGLSLMERQPGCRREISSSTSRFFLIDVATCAVQREGDVVRFEAIGGVEEASREAAPQEPARLLIADDHALVREGLRTMLSGEDGLSVIAEAHNGAEALSICRQQRPDLVLMDVRMPVMDGLEATRKIKEEMPKTSVVMVTMHENPDYLFEAVKAGAAGYVLKDASGERLLGAVRRTLEGESPLDEELAMRLLVRLTREKEGN